MGVGARAVTASHDGVWGAGAGPGAYLIATPSIGSINRSGVPDDDWGVIRSRTHYDGTINASTQGDLHIPQRAAAIPEKFQRMLVPHKMQHVLCTGNLGTAQQHEELKR